MNMISAFSKSAIRPVIAGALALAVPALALAPAIPATAATDARLDQAVGALRAISTLKANFIQTDRNGQRVKGVLSLKQPGRIRFEYEKGVNLLIVGNGSSLTMIDYDVAQVQRWPIKNSPLGALLDPKRDVAKFGKVQPTSSPDVISIEVKDPGKPEYGVITLIFVKKPGAPGGLELVSWVALDSQNQRTTVRLADHRYGLAIPDSTFKWRDPRVTTRRPG
ncbi:outer membrane lipoprotein carrier protein LolA [Altererythrobacter sp. CC-YST694]|uniref:LolA family protein n=1 Tax=Altererythrobacter sp. CC-YST694 TaxID=2755038 RepID=UPI001D030BA6|nr:outer membrane lipoprotein carrier protein LolA [Altererythrobacter sp. CC-YST694]MCB5425537.1 outer membrane lipoprotein carrier protein LolA [Altererythrobacter sp. CC-YST694]